MYRSWDDYCEEQEKLVERLPECDKCGEHITSDYAYDLSDIGDGLLCEECFEEWCDKRRVDPEDLIKDEGGGW